ncbi:MAG: hypothetical protein ACKVY0_02435 [Prosthecobacter sp.]|uniref:hypothetical protein n=1 Tax=Prosthecobacter sp. TaxID=1965333 RepID=UPI0039026DBB
MKNQTPKETVPALPKTTAKNLTRKDVAKVSAGNIQPLDTHAHPMARDSKGLGSRTEIRAQVPRVPAPRQSLRPVERSGQKRSHQ